MDEKYIVAGIQSALECAIWIVSVIAAIWAAKGVYQKTDSAIWAVVVAVATWFATRLIVSLLLFALVLALLPLVY